MTRSTALKISQKSNPITSKISLRIPPSFKNDSKDSSSLKITFKSLTASKKTLRKEEEEKQLPLPPINEIPSEFSSIVDVVIFMKDLLMMQKELNKPPEGYAPRQLAAIFSILPSKKKYPDYYQIIEKPLSLKCILDRARQNGYQSLAELKEDFETMFKNALTYNQKNSIIHEDALLLLNFIQRVFPFIKLVKESHNSKKSKIQNSSPSVQSKEPVDVIEGAEVIQVDDEKISLHLKQKKGIKNQIDPSLLTPIQELFLAVSKDAYQDVLNFLTRSPKLRTSTNLPATISLPTLENVTKQFNTWPPNSNTEALDNVRWSIIHCGSYFGSLKVIDSLVERCGTAILESRDALYDSTAIAWAAFGNQLEMCSRLIIAYGVAINVKNWMNQSPLELVSDPTDDWKVLFEVQPNMSYEGHRVLLLVQNLITRILRADYAGKPYSALLGASSWRSLAQSKPVLSEFLVEAIRRCRECQKFASVRTGPSEDATMAVAESILNYFSKALPKDWPLLSRIHTPPISSFGAMDINYGAYTKQPERPVVSMAPLRRWEAPITATGTKYYNPALVTPSYVPQRLVPFPVSTPVSSSPLTVMGLSARSPSIFGIGTTNLDSGINDFPQGLYVPIRVLMYGHNQNFWEFAFISTEKERAASLHVPNNIEILLVDISFLNTEDISHSDYILLQNRSDRIEPFSFDPMGKVSFRIHLKKSVRNFESVELLQGEANSPNQGYSLLGTFFLHMN